MYVHCCCCCYLFLITIFLVLAAFVLLFSIFYVTLVFCEKKIAWHLARTITFTNAIVVAGAWASQSSGRLFATICERLILSLSEQRRVTGLPPPECNLKFNFAQVCIYVRQATWVH